MQFTKFVAASVLATIAAASPIANALPWANANPSAQAAAQAYAQAYAEAQAIGHADPEAYALAASADDCASIACHASCGMMIIAAQACSENPDDSYSGPYEAGCLCGSDSTPFMAQYASCMDCGWTLWKYYSPYLIPALEDCGKATEPTGTSRCSTTLTASYTKDPSIDISTITATN